MTTFQNMMKTGIVLLLCFLGGIVHAQQTTFSVKGKIRGAGKDAKVVLSYSEGRRASVVDTVPLKRNKFAITGVIPGPGIAKLTLFRKDATSGEQRNPADELMVYLSDEPIILRAKDSLSNVTMKGSQSNKEYQAYRASTREADDELSAINRKWASLDEEGRKKFWFERDQRTRNARALRRQLLADFADRQPASYFALQALQELSAQQVDVPLVAPLFDKLSPALKASESGQRLKERIDLASKTIVGAIAPDFVQNDVDDNPVRLSDFRGKYVLLDFWASWCGPCRAENPNLVRAYEKYKGRNFEILGISLDRPGQKQAWLDAIANDGLTWPQVSDLQGWQNAVAKLYSINAVPASFLLDPGGKIIALDLRGDQLNETLEAVLN